MELTARVKEQNSRPQLFFMLLVTKCCCLIMLVCAVEEGCVPRTVLSAAPVQIYGTVKGTLETERFNLGWSGGCSVGYCGSVGQKKWKLELCGYLLHH